jgi:hypothetical protein
MDYRFVNGFFFACSPPPLATPCALVATACRTYAHSKLALKGEIHVTRMRMGERRAYLRASGLIDDGHARQKKGGTQGGGGARA